MSNFKIFCLSIATALLTTVVPTMAQAVQGDKMMDQALRGFSRAQHLSRP